MTLFFPDLNVWLALSVSSHTHSADAWKWMDGLPADARLIFSRYTQIGLLRLLTNNSVMGEQTLLLREAWDLYDRWLADPHVDFYPEPRGMDAMFRQSTEPFAAQPATKAVGDCWLLAYSHGIDATLVTFDLALWKYAHRHGYAAIIPG